MKKIAIVGLGLIGGSFAKALQAANKRSSAPRYEVLGVDRTPAVLERAQAEGAISGEATDLAQVDFAVVALPPVPTRNFLQTRGKEFRSGTIVFDVCGVKKELCDFVRALTDRKYAFFGCHPMAGREVSGFASALPTLFLHASFVITRAEGLGQDEAKLEDLKELVRELGFEKIAEMTPEAHDRGIAFTSQLCHLVSSAYVKSDALGARDGLTAGSFRDLSRVAYLDENLWTELFLENRLNLLHETEQMIAHLAEYRDALQNGDAPKLKSLLAEGKALAENIRAKK